MEALQLDIEAKDQEAERLRQQAELDQAMQQRVIEGLRTQATQLRQQAVVPLAELGSLQAQMQEKQDAWDRQKSELESQADRMMELLRGMGILAGSGQAERSSGDDGQYDQQGLGPSIPDYIRPSDYQKARAHYGLTAPDAQALHIQELSLLLTEARQQVETYRRQLSARSLAPEELMRDIKRLKADNQRLVALLARVPEYRALAAEVAAESGVHYLPLEECFMVRGLVQDLHPQLLDRPVADVTGGDSAGAGRRRDPDGPDPSLTLVLDEQYHWVPRRALEVGAALMRRMMPALPMSQLLALVAELNKIWRDRERQRLAEVAAAHREELRKVQHSFQQRAPYEAVVAGQKINELKRRMRAQAVQAAAAAAAAKGAQKRGEEDSKVMLHAGLSSIRDLSKQMATLAKRNKKLASKAARQQAIAAVATAAAASARADPLCSACLDRVLKPDARDSASGLGHHQQLTKPGSPDVRTGAINAAGLSGHTAHKELTEPWGAADYAPAYAGEQVYTEGGDGYRYEGYSAPAMPAADGGGGGLSWQPVVAAMPPASNPGTPTRHAGSAQPLPAGAYAPQLNSSRGGIVQQAPAAGVQLESKPTEPTITALDPAGNAPPETATGPDAAGGGSGSGLGTTVEVSTASLAEWRHNHGGTGVEVCGGSGDGGWTASVSTAGEGASPVAVKLRLGAGLGGGTQRSVAHGTVQVRGAPVRVRVRFPRHDVSIN